ncbi:hypothetical protein [Rosistilla oblonga]|uniref:hypothetical protein n=1 Tax=Rosistilla oblonga TaxID=2527990 RepID=UPI003A969D58
MKPQKQNPSSPNRSEDPAARVRDFIKNRKVDEPAVVETDNHDLDWDLPVASAPAAPAAPAMFPVTATAPAAPVAAPANPKKRPEQHTTRHREPREESSDPSLQQIWMVGIAMLAVQGMMLLMMFVLICVVVWNAPATQWEYMVASPTSAELDQLGAQGWEVVSSRWSRGALEFSYEMVLKRRT